MMDYWRSLSSREKFLLGAAALVAVVTLAQFLIVRPLVAAKADARLALEAASRQLDVVSTELATTQSAPPPRATSSQDLRSDLLRLANGRGLTVSRLQTADNGRLVMQFERAGSTLIYAWLAEAEQTFGVTPEQASMFADTDGTVRASFEFSGAGS